MINHVNYELSPKNFSLQNNKDQNNYYIVAYLFSGNVYAARSNGSIGTFFTKANHLCEFICEGINYSFLLTLSKVVVIPHKH